MDYQGQTTKDGFISFVSSVNMKGSTIIENVEEMKEMIKHSTDKFFISFANSKV